MGKAMTWTHVDGSVTEGVSDRTFAYVAAEQDVNRQYFWREDTKDYALVFNLDSYDAEATWAVRRIGDPEALIPAEVREAAEAAMTAFLGALNRQEERRMNAAAAPHFLADALEEREGWVLEDDGTWATLRSWDDLWFTMLGSDGDGWQATGYHSLHAKGSERFSKEFNDLADALDYCEAYITRNE